MIINGILAGLSIGLGGYAFLSVENKLIGAFLFSVGLFLVCTMGYYLFTGKICYLYSDKQFNIKYMLTVLLSNAVGAIAFGRLARLMNPALIDKANQICANKLSEGFLVIPLGIFCNLLIFYAVHEFKIQQNEVVACFAIVLCVTIFIVCGFEHCVANMFYFSVADFTPGCVTYLLLNIVGNTIGGIIGGRIEKVRIK